MRTLSLVAATVALAATGAVAHYLRPQGQLPATSTSVTDVCWKGTHDRGVGKPISTCHVRFTHLRLPRALQPECGSAGEHKVQAGFVVCPLNYLQPGQGLWGASSSATACRIICCDAPAPIPAQRQAATPMRVTSLGTSHAHCPSQPPLVKSGWLCYPECATNYTGGTAAPCGSIARTLQCTAPATLAHLAVGPVCWENCPPGVRLPLCICARTGHHACSCPPRSGLMRVLSAVRLATSKPSQRSHTVRCPCRGEGCPLAAPHPPPILPPLARSGRGQAPAVQAGRAV